MDIYRVYIYIYPHRITGNLHHDHETNIPTTEVVPTLGKPGLKSRFRKLRLSAFGIPRGRRPKPLENPDLHVGEGSVPPRI